MAHTLLSETYSKSLEGRWVSIHYPDMQNTDVEWSLASAYVLYLY